MEKPLILKTTEEAPGVTFDRQKAVFEISGRSLPEDPEKLYRPLLGWMEEYVKNPLEETIFEIKLDYFNSGSVKQILKILILLEKIPEKNGKVSINWYYDEEDELMEIKGQEFKSILNIPLHLKVK